VAQKSKLLTQYNSLLFLSHPVGLPHSLDHRPTCKTEWLQQSRSVCSF